MDGRISILHISTDRFISLLLMVLLCLTTVVGCSEKQKAVSSIRQTYEEGNYEDTMLLCRQALRKNIHAPDVYYYYGLSLLELGRDYESFRRFDEAVAADSTLAPVVAEILLAKGRDAFDKGQKRRAADRLKFTAGLDPAVALGSLKYLVADAYFDERGFEQAAAFYAAAIEERPDTAAAESAYFNLAECYVALGDSSQALWALDELLERFPKGRLAGQAEFKLVNLRYEHARAEFESGNYLAVVEEINTLLERSSNVSLVQRARFLLGEAYERLEDYTSAYDQYKTIIDQDRGASGRIVERARDKINALRDSGLL